MMEQAIASALPTIGGSVIFLAMAVKLFGFLMDSNREYRQDLQQRNKYLEDENKALRQALFAHSNPDAMRLSTALLSRAPKTELEP